MAIPSHFAILQAASSSWTQSNWTNNNYSSISSAIATNTPNQITLAGSEKLTNTSFETDLTNWAQTPENTAGVFNSTSFLADSGAVAAWPMDDTTSAQSYARAIRSLGRQGTSDFSRG